ncbi:MAG TPA: hypothetical protein VN673_06175, partial [Clostridia bacterium]|nr:hypothetical protein [Clostridia bacterium]
MKLKPLLYSGMVLMVFLAAIAAWEAHYAWFHLRQLQGQVDGLEAGTFHLAEHVFDYPWHVTNNIGSAEKYRGSRVSNFISVAGGARAWARTNGAVVTIAASPEVTAFLVGVSLCWIYFAKVGPLSAKLQAARFMIERQERLASLGTLAAGLAHEIRSPLTAIRIRLRGLKRSLA